MLGRSGCDLASSATGLIAVATVALAAFARLAALAFLARFTLPFALVLLARLAALRLRRALVLGASAGALALWALVDVVGAARRHHDDRLAVVTLDRGRGECHRFRR